MAFGEVFCICAFILGVCVYALLVHHMDWGLLSDHLIAHSQIDVLPTTLLGIIRSSFALCVWSVVVEIMRDRTCVEITIVEEHGRKHVVLLRGYERLSMFTVWSWILQGVYFTLSAYASLRAVEEGLLSALPALDESAQRVAWVLFEISLPIAFLISSIVTFLLLPALQDDAFQRRLFFTPTALLMHNANVWFMVFEFATNALPIALSHVVFVLCYGLAYVAFSWWWYRQRGYFHYFFLDFNARHALAAHAALVVGAAFLYFAVTACLFCRSTSMHGASTTVSLIP